MALCSSVENEPDIEFIPIMKQELVVIVPHFHPLALQDNIDLMDTVSYPYVYWGINSGLRSFVDSLFHKINVVPKISYEVEEDSAVAGLVAANFGIAIIPNITLLKLFNVKPLQITNPPHERYIYLAYVKNRFQTPAVLGFMNFIIKNHKCSYN